MKTACFSTIIIKFFFLSDWISEKRQMENRTCNENIIAMR